jgi:YfiH family protein
LPGLVHGVSTKNGGEPPYYNNLSKHVGDDIETVLHNRRRFCISLGIDISRLAHANQIHSANVSVIDQPGLYKECDTLITAEENLYLVISVADCLPVMIYDNQKKVIANIHSGWRGTQLGIAGAAVEKMRSRFGSLPEDMTVFIGPGISAENFEVGEEVAELFESKYVKKKNSQKYSADIKQCVYDQLTDSGILKQNIEISPYCTFSHKDYLHSYRRDRESSGRMFAVIGMKTDEN